MHRGGRKRFPTFPDSFTNPGQSPSDPELSIVHYKQVYYSGQPGKKPGHAAPDHSRIFPVLHIKNV